MSRYREQIDSGILFIIALFFLACCTSCGRGTYGVGFGGYGGGCC